MLEGKSVLMKKLNWASFINLYEDDIGTTREIGFTDEQEIDYLDWLRDIN